MKAFFTLLFIAPFCLFSQEANWFEPGSSWTYNYQTISGPDHYQATFGISETTFAGRTCAKMETDIFPFGCSPVSQPYYFYESHDSIFFATEVDSTFRLAYDFNANVGDTWVHSVPVELFDTFQNLQVQVQEINILNIDGVSVKEMILVYSDVSLPPFALEFYPEPISVLEFIGSTTGLFVPLGRLAACDMETAITIQCFDSPSLNYTNPEFGTCILSALDIQNSISLKVYPNPASTFIVIDTPIEGNSKIRILQSDGKTILSQQINSQSARVSLPKLNSGIYFVEIADAENRYVGKLMIQ